MSPQNNTTCLQEILTTVEEYNKTNATEYAVILVKKSDRPKLRYVTYLEETPFIHEERP